MGRSCRVNQRQRGRGRTRIKQTHITRQLAVVQVSLEDHQLALLQILNQLGRRRRHAPVAAGVGPEVIRAQRDFPFGVQLAPVRENTISGLLLVRRKSDRINPLGALLVARSLVESLGVLQDIERVREIPGDDVRDEPGDVLGVEDDVGREAGFQQVAGEDEVDEELEAGVVEHDVDAAVFLAAALGVLQHLESRGEVVCDDLVLVRLARLGALEFLHLFEAEVHEQGEVGGVAPEADFAHFDEEGFFGFGALFFGELGEGGVWGSEVLEDFVVVEG